MQGTSLGSSLKSLATIFLFNNQGPPLQSIESQTRHLHTMSHQVSKLSSQDKTNMNYCKYSCNSRDILEQNFNSIFSIRLIA